MAFESSLSHTRSRTIVRPRTRRRGFYFETRIFWMAFLAGFPGSLLSMVLLWDGEYSLKVQLTFTLVVVIFWIGFALAVRERIVTTMRTISNLLAAFHEGDFSLRAIRGTGDDVMQEVGAEINLLGDVLRAQRISAMEAASLLRKVMDEIEVAVLAFDENTKLRLVNQHAQRLLDKSEEALRGRTAEELGLGNALEGESPRILDLATPSGMGRWELRRGEVRLHGIPHHLVVLSDLTRALRDEERQAWKRLVQVLRHEINNSLAPIHSLATSLRGLMARDPRPSDWEDDLHQGLNVIGDRSERLNRFMASYSRLTKLPKPRYTPLQVHEWVLRVVNLELTPCVTIDPGPDITIQADGDQLDQALINIIKNAVEAVEGSGGGVRVGWSIQQKPFRHLEMIVEDEGMGILNPDNLFIPFFTTKSQGSGLGLMISRQIIEAHNGALTLDNRTDKPGCIARIRLPLG